MQPRFQGLVITVIRENQAEVTVIPLHAQFDHVFPKIVSRNVLKTITFLYIEQDVFSNMKDYYGVEIFEPNKLSQEKYQRYLSYIVLNNMLLGNICNDQVSRPGESCRVFQ